MIFFTPTQAAKIHESLIKKTGGMNGLRDEKLFDSALCAPFQKWSGTALYPDIFDKASQLCYGLIENHPFLDGNKRTGVHLTLLFLKLNGEKLAYSQKDLSEFGWAVASGKKSKDQIKAWLLQHRISG
ncbi:MAG: type II toxin-antitoxin system death-on-curing family toxin [Spirochaetaceae bacterium]|nr:type II toxin-antitoxin system death-on-curing family toxin [Spirochaetaceae bacterium]